MDLPLSSPDHALFANHLSFLARHRGNRRDEERGVWIDGASDELSTWTPLGPMSELPAGLPAVRPAPWTAAHDVAVLRERGYHAGSLVSYMERDRDASLARVDPAATVEVARSEVALREFAAVQAAGFLSGADGDDAWWAALFTEMALKNRLDPTQTLYVARVGDLAAACTLVVRDSGVAGIYAVATRPQFRRRGLARVLLERASDDAASIHGITRVILQATTGGEPEAYYARLGFTTRYQLAVWRQAAAP
ncbi:MAG: GNAT family N-acetyltransferase [Deltaproteobacteria bacterium]|nr:GNAT family N-acetyltransferase [Deltaproteobacteria bacterium]